MVKFESSTVVKRKLWTEFGKNTRLVKPLLEKHFNAFVKLVPLKIENVLEDYQKLPKKRLTKLLKLLKMNHNRVFDLLLQPAPFHEQQHIELSVIETVQGVICTRTL